MVSRQSGHSVRMAGLERAARLAGEAFGYEDMPVLSRLSRSILPILVAAAVAFAIMAGLTAFILR